MRKKKFSKRVKHFAKEKLGDVSEWFMDKEHPYSKLNRTVFFYDLLKIIGLVLIFLIIHSNLDRLNGIVLVFIKFGSTLQLILLYFIIKKSWHIILNLRYGIRGLSNGVKAIIAVGIVFLLFLAFLHQNEVIDSTIQACGKIDLKGINPIKISGNFSLLRLNKNSSMKNFKSNLFPKKEVIKINPLSVRDCTLCMMYSMAGGCSVLGMIGESDGVSNIKGKTCEEACGNEEMEYYKYECVNDKLICYCEK